MTAPAAPAPVYRFGAFELDVTNRQLSQHGQPLPLRARPFDLLVTLVESAGRLVMKDALLDRVWPNLVVEENNLQVHVTALRKLLGHEAIATVPGRGYRFTREVDTASASSYTAIAEPAAPATTVAVPPESASILIGRDDDVDVLSGWTRQHRLVTIAGTGGIGKTRLAQAVARRLQTQGGEVHWVDLAGLSDPALVASHVTAALGIDVAPGALPLGALVAAFRARGCTLVLDNAEHVLGAVAEIATAVLVGTPQVRLLITSQAPLHVSGEHVYRLTALQLPPAAETASAALAARHGAIAFFVARARAADRRFALDDANVRIVCEICRRLDGIPLQLELAAARVPLLGVEVLAARLDECFRLLRRGSRDAPTRQQTLEAVYDWSHELLSPDEQLLFRRLGTLVGSFGLDDACAIARDAALDDWTIIDLLGALVDRSLVAVEADDPPRYRLLETGRAYAQEKLRKAGECEPVQRAIRLYETMGEHAARASRSAEAMQYFAAALDVLRLLPELPVRRARELELSFVLGTAVQTTLGPAHPRCEEIYRRAVELARDGAADERAFKALWGYWHFLCMAGRDREAAPYADEIVTMSRQLHDDGLELEACHAALTTQQLLGNAPALIANAERAIALYDHSRHHHLTFAFGGHDPGICALGQGSVGLWLTGRYDEALAMAKRALEAGAAIEHGYSRAVAYYYTAMMYAAYGRQDAFRRSAERLVALSTEHGMEMLDTEARFFIGYARCNDGDVDSGLADMRAALSTIEANGDLAFVLFYIALLADALLQRADAVGPGGQSDAVDAAWALIDNGVLHAAAGQGFFLPELHRLRGEVLRRRGEKADAIRQYVAARDLADAQGARSLALRAAVSLAKAKRNGAVADVRRRLAEIAGGDDARDVIEARDV